MRGVAGKPRRFVSQPLRFVSQPLCFISQPLRFISEPRRFISQPRRFIRVPPRFGSVPLRFVWSEAPWRAPEPRRVRGGRILERTALRLRGRKRQCDREQRIL
jgi:hypothetical protein